MFALHSPAVSFSFIAVVDIADIRVACFSTAFKFCRGSDKKLPIYQKLNHARLERQKPSSLVPSGG